MFDGHTLGMTVPSNAVIRGSTGDIVASIRSNSSLRVNLRDEPPRRWGPLVR